MEMCKIIRSRETEMTKSSDARMIMTEAIGTGVLVFVVIAAASSMAVSGVNPLLLGVIFALAFLLAYYLASTVSGGHLNPLVTLGMLFSGRMSGKLALGYIVAQIIGGLIGGLLAFWLFMPQIPLMASSQPEVDYYNLLKVMIGQIVLTFLFVMAFLVVTANPYLAGVGGIIIAAILGLIIVISMQAGGWAGANVLTYFQPILYGDLITIIALVIAPLIGAFLAGLLFRVFNRYSGEKLYVDSCGKPILDDCCRKQYVRYETVYDACGNPKKDSKGCVMKQKILRHDAKPTHLQETQLSYMARKFQEETGVAPEYAWSKFMTAKEQTRSVISAGKSMLDEFHIKEKLEDAYHSSGVDELLHGAKNEMKEFTQSPSSYASRMRTTLVPNDEIFNRGSLI